MKLFIDDIRDAPDDSWTVVRTITEAIRLLATQSVTEISLDHDISHMVSVGDVGRPFPCKETFEAVAWFLWQGTYQGKVTIHSANPIGAMKIGHILENANIPYEIKLSKPSNGLE